MVDETVLEVLLEGAERARELLELQVLAGDRLVRVEAAQVDVMIRVPGDFWIRYAAVRRRVPSVVAG